MVSREQIQNTYKEENFYHEDETPKAGCPERWLMPLPGNIQGWVGQHSVQQDLIEDQMSQLIANQTRQPLKVNCNTSHSIILQFYDQNS